MKPVRRIFTGLDDDALGADESDPFGVQFIGGVVTLSAAKLASGATFAVTLELTISTSQFYGHKGRVAYRQHLR